MYQQGYNYCLTSDEEAKRELLNKKYEIVTNERDLVIKYFKMPTSEGINSIFMTNAEIINTILTDFPRIKLNPIQIGRTMSQLGFKAISKKINGQLQRGYVVVYSNNQDNDPNFGVNENEKIESFLPF